MHYFVTHYYPALLLSCLKKMFVDTSSCCIQKSVPNLVKINAKLLSQSRHSLPAVLTRNTLDCDQSNVYSAYIIFSTISQDLHFCSFFLYRRSANDLSLWNKFWTFVITD